MMVKDARGREKFYKYKPLIITLSRLCSMLPLGIRKALFEHHRMTKGTRGLVLRYVLLKSLAVECGDNVSVHPGVYLLRPDKLRIGRNVSVHPMCYIDATGGIDLGDDVSIAHGATILSTSHNFAFLDQPIKNQGVEEKKP